MSLPERQHAHAQCRPPLRACEPCLEARQPRSQTEQFALDLTSVGSNSPPPVRHCESPATPVAHVLLCCVSEAQNAARPPLTRAAEGRRWHRVADITLADHKGGRHQAALQKPAVADCKKQRAVQKACTRCVLVAAAPVSCTGARRASTHTIIHKAPAQNPTVLLRRALDGGSQVCSYWIPSHLTTSNVHGRSGTT